MYKRKNDVLVDATRSKVYSRRLATSFPDSIFDEVNLPELPSFGHRPSDDLYESPLRAVCYDCGACKLITVTSELIFIKWVLHRFALDA